MSVGPIDPFRLPVAPTERSIEGIVVRKPDGAGAVVAPEGLANPQHDKLSVGESFGKVLQDAHAAEATSNRADEAFAKGDPSVGIHEVVIAAEKANISVRYMTTLKNKAIEAYRELMNTQV